MILYLVQHGPAVAREIDPERPLSDTGRQEVASLAMTLHEAGVRTHRLAHSPKTRAAQTAALLAPQVMPTGEPEAVAGLLPEDPVTPFAEQVASWMEDTLIVGHLPFLARLAGWLLAGDDTREPVAFRPGSVLCLERDAAHVWRVAWMLRPGLLPEREGL